MAVLSERVLVVNAGSTSLKLSLVDEGDRSIAVASLAELPRVDTVGHRIVHGGASLRDPIVIDDVVVEKLRDAAELAPLHAHPAIAAVVEARRLLPEAVHVAVLDTSFHSTLPDVASTYALPAELRRVGIRRFGFHGISVQGVSEHVRVGRLVVCHLGGGASVTAVRDGRSVDTTMGFTPLEGIPMGTRSGSIDPGALIYLLRHGTTPDELESALEHRSGLVGLAGTDDVRALERSTSGRSRLAVDLFCYRTAQAVAAMSVPLGGLDALAFTGGIGVGSAIVRAGVCAQLEHLGVQVDVSANAAAQGDAEVATTRSSVRVVVVTSREDLVIARAARLLAAPR